MSFVHEQTVIEAVAEVTSFPHNAEPLLNPCG